MYTFDDFTNFDRVETQRREKLSADLARLLDRAQELAQAMKEAAEAEDTKAYSKAETEYNAIRAQVTAKEAAMKRPAEYTRENVLSVWADYAAEYNADFAELRARYEAARHDAARLYLDMVQAQGRALAYRQTFARLAGYDPARYEHPADLAELATLPRDAEVRHNGRSDAISADALCYMLSGDIPRTAYFGIKQVTQAQVPEKINLTGYIDPDTANLLARTGNLL